MPNPWFKFYGGEYLSDPKIANMTASERSCLLTIFCLASESSDAGTIRFLTEEILLDKSGIKWDPYFPEEWDATKGVLDKFARLKIIVLGEDGIIEVVNWEKRQESYLTGAERQARFREKQKESNAPRYESNARIEKNRIESGKASALQDIRIEKGLDHDGDIRAKTEPKYRHSKEVFSWFPRAEKSWQINTTECKHAELLWERGQEAVKKALAYHEKHKDDEGYGYKVVKPSDLERKWEDIKEYARRTK